MSSDPTTPQPSQLLPPRVIVLCFDGTSSQFDDTNTNIVKFHGLLKKSPLEQIVYYQAGVGTYVDPGTVSPWLTGFAKFMDALFASYLGDHVKSGYKFLMQNYRPGDKVCLFGFSRGAHTARALAGMLHVIGLLPRDNDEQIAFAYGLYKRTDDAGVKLADGFKRTFCTPVPIKFIGVWDTVSSVGLVYGRDLPFSAGNSNVEIFRHALSLDERRARFQPCLYRYEDGEKIGKTAHSQTRPGRGVDFAVRRLSSQDHYQIPGLSRTPSSSDSPSPGGNKISIVSSKPPPDFPRVLEVWFAGCHSDVGGGSVEDVVRYSLGDISLRWMVKQVLLSDCGIMFDDAALARADIDVSTIIFTSPAQQNAEQPRRRKPEAEASTIWSALSGGGGSKENLIPKGKKKEEEAARILSKEPEVLADTYDELVIGFSSFSWSKLGRWLGFWLLEYLPVTHTWQDRHGNVISKRKWNRGRGRIIRSDPERPLYFHESVRQRKVATDPEYKPHGRREDGHGDLDPQYVQ